VEVVVPFQYSSLLAPSVTAVTTLSKPSNPPPKPKLIRMVKVGFKFIPDPHEVDEFRCRLPYSEEERDTAAMVLQMDGSTRPMLPHVWIDSTTLPPPDEPTSSAMIAARTVSAKRLPNSARHLPWWEQYWL